jgi:hypothetical protein
MRKIFTISFSLLVLSYFLGFIAPASAVDISTSVTVGNDAPTFADDATCGMYSMELAIKTFSEHFNREKPVSEQTPNEFRAIVNWCISVSASFDDVDIARRVAALRLSGEEVKL